MKWSLLIYCLFGLCSHAAEIVPESDPHKLLLKLPGSVEINQQLTQAYDGCKKADVASSIALIEQVLAEKMASSEQKAFAQLFLSQLLQRQKKTAEAEQALAAARNLYGSNHEALAHSWMTLARMAAACAQQQEALQAWHQAASLPDLAPDKHVFFMMELGKAQVLQGDGKAAVKTLTDAAETEGILHEQEFAVILQRADAFKLLGDHDACFKDYSLLTNWIEMPDTLRAKAFVNRGILYHAIKDFDRAIEDATKVIDSLPAATAEDIASAHYNRAGVWLERGKTKEALADYHAVTLLAEAPAKTRAFAFTKIADAHVRAGRFGDALTELSKAAALSELPRDTLAFVLVKRAIQNARSNHTEAAIQDFTTVLATPEADVSSISEALYSRGTLLLASRRYDEATADFTRATQLEGVPPGYLGNIWLKFGSLYEKTGRTNEMLAALARSADIPGVTDEHVATALNYRALQLAEAGDSKAAITDLNRVISLAGITPLLRMKSRALRGLQYIKLGDSEQSLADLDAAISFPDFPESMLSDLLFKRALIYDHLKRPDDADPDRKRARLINEKLLKK